MNGMVDLEACTKQIERVLAQDAPHGEEKYPQD